MQYFNLAGVLAVAGLCLVQWQANRAVHLQANRLEKIRLEQASTILDRDKQIKGAQADLDALREHVAKSSLESRAANSNLTVVQAELRQLQSERDQLKQSVTNWAAAVSARDVQLKQLAGQVKTMAAERNDTVTKFNELAEKYNGVARDLNERTAQLNEMAQRAGEAKSQ